MLSWTRQPDLSEISLYPARFTRTPGGQTAVAGSIESGRSWVGAYDMSGNVLEWTSSVYRQYPYPTDASGFVLDDASDDENISDFRTARGGSWGNSLFDLHAASRVGFSPETSSAGIGFAVRAMPIDALAGIRPMVVRDTYPA
ncbi:MAG: SUMF1/EgtB/PvdO family nonheme iron enzyme [Anaerolineae bacterium]